jgi:hypothetical protein
LIIASNNGIELGPDKITKISIPVKEKLQTYYATTYARSGVNQIWILKNSKELFANIKPQNFSQINSIKTYGFSNIYTAIPHDNLKSRV